MMKAKVWPRKMVGLRIVAGLLLALAIVGCQRHEVTTPAPPAATKEGLPGPANAGVATPVAPEMSATPATEASTATESPTTSGSRERSIE